MTDIVLVLTTLAFVALCVAYIGWCDRIIGPDELHTDSADVAEVADGSTSADQRDAVSA